MKEHMKNKNGYTLVEALYRRVDGKFSIDGNLLSD